MNVLQLPESSSITVVKFKLKLKFRLDLVRLRLDWKLLERVPYICQSNNYQKKKKMELCV